MIRTATLTLLLTASLQAQTHKPGPPTKIPHQLPPQPTGPTLLFDTTAGRITCRLFDKEAPTLSANFAGLAAGTKSWLDGETHQQVTGKPFFDNTAFGGVTDGIIGGDRLGGGTGLAGPSVPTEKNALTFDRPGILAMARAPESTPQNPLTSASMFYILEHADMEYVARGGTVIGLCDEASLPTITAISHAMLTVENQATQPVMINHVTVLHDGDATPPPPTPTATFPLTAVTPAMAPPPSPDPTGPTALIEVAQPNGPSGTLTCRLFNETPIATANFIGLTNGTKDWRLPSTKALQHNKRFYDGLSFKRLIPDFMIQQSDMPGDPEGGGDIGIHFPNETLPNLTFDRPGRLAYANAGPNTNASEFFITEHPSSRLNGNFTIFGQCDEASVKLVEAIARVPRDEHNKPNVPVTIKKITIQPATK